MNAQVSFVLCNVFAFVGLLVFHAVTHADSFRLRFQKVQNKPAAIASIQLGKGDKTFELFWKNDEGVPLKTYDSLESWLKKKGKSLLFAANSGIYRDNPSFAPIGLHIENGRALTRLSFAKGCGNFCWYSGVFFIRENRAMLLPREEASADEISASRIGLQSGPLFMRSGELQGTWSESSYNLNRSAICTSKQPDEILLLLVIDGTNFREFYSIAKEFGCNDALFLDGSVSSFYDGTNRKRIGNQTEAYAGLIAITERQR